jgi:uncharacterized protein
VLEADNYSFPVGRVEFLYLGPMTFEEYLSGTNNEGAVELLQQVTVEERFNEAVHNTFLKHLRNYLIVGGMPEAINAYRETQSYLEVERTKQSIITTYQADFHKYGRKVGGRKADTHLLNRVLATIPIQLGQKIILETAVGRAKAVQVIDVHGGFKKFVVTLLVMRTFLNLSGASITCMLSGSDEH